MKCIYLGRSQFTSKKGTACFTVNFGIPFLDKKGEGFRAAIETKGEGFRAANFFVSQEQYKDFANLETPCALNCDIRFINGANALISYDISSESIELWD